MTVEIIRLHEAFGAELRGVDLSEPLDADDFAAVHRAHLDYGIVLFRDQHLTPGQHKAFSLRFGPAEIHVVSWYRLPGHPELIVVSNKKSSLTPTMCSLQSPKAMGCSLGSFDRMVPSPSLVAKVPTNYCELI